MSDPAERERKIPCSESGCSTEDRRKVAHVGLASGLASPWNLYNNWQRWGYLAILFSVVTSNYFDYYILSVVLEPIKHEFKVTDTMLGILTGSCFSLAYAVTALPISRWADYGNRRTVITSALAGWSLMTALCGFATSFVQLAVARFSVGMMEPGAMPPAQSLVADYFPPEKRATAISVLGNGGSAVGWLLGAGIGGYIAANYGWRAAFIFAGLPGVALAVVVKVVLPEPRVYPGYNKTDLPPERFWKTLSRLRAKRSIVFAVLGVSMYSIFSYGVTVFVPSFVVRSLHTPLEEFSMTWGSAISVANIVGALIGGRTADFLGKRDMRWYAWLPAIGAAVGLPLYWLALLATRVRDFISFEFLGELALSIGCPIVSVVVLTASGSHRRAIASAAMFFSATIFGVTLGPLLSGALSDALESQYHGDSLRYALIIMCGFLVPAAVSFFRASHTIAMDKED